MADQFSSANKAISIAGGKPGGGVNAKNILSGMTKDVKKRWLAVGLVGIAFIVGASTMLSSASRTDAPPPKKDTGVVDTTPKGMSSAKDWRAQTGAELEQMKRDQLEDRRARADLLASVEQLKKQLAQQPAGGAAATQQQAQRPSVNLNLPPPPEPPKTLVPYAPPATSVAPTPSASAPVAQTAPAPAPAPEPKRSAARSFIPQDTTTAAAGGATETQEFVTNDKRGFLPAGSFAKSTLISGVEAFTGGTAQSQPQPLVVRIDANAILPNAASYQIKGCHVLASVWGDMSSERVFGRLATLTCVDSQNRLVLSEEVEGVLVDSDGKNGIRGALQDRQGAKLARSLLAGFAEGVATAMGAAQSTVTRTAFGATTTVDPSRIMRSSGYSGAEKAAEQLSDFYLKQAEATMPIIAVDAGRKISVLFTKSKALKFETTDAYRIEPKSKLHVERMVD